MTARNSELLIRGVGPRRILFGTDLPITRMRVRRECEQGRYVNVVPEGLYGDVSPDSHMQEVEGDDAARLTFFMHEEIDAFRRATLKTGLGSNDTNDVFCRDSAKMLCEAGMPELFLNSQGGIS